LRIQSPAHRGRFHCRINISNGIHDQRVLLATKSDVRRARKYQLASPSPHFPQVS
jgi:hypothetical protein